MSQTLSPHLFLVIRTPSVYVLVPQCLFSIYNILYTFATCCTGIIMACKKWKLCTSFYTNSMYTHTRLELLHLTTVSVQICFRDRKQQCFGNQTELGRGVGWSETDIAIYTADLIRVINKKILQKLRARDNIILVQKCPEVYIINTR